MGKVAAKAASQRDEVGQDVDSLLRQRQLARLPDTVWWYDQVDAAGLERIGFLASTKLP